jgi:type I restriction enzyme S subunit
MSKPWATVKLGEVITHRKEFVRIDDFNTYKRCRVQLYAKGIVLRDLVLGSELKTKEQQICCSGDFLVAEIDAKVGGYGIVPDELDGAIVSSHYFLFEVNRDQLDRNFLGYFIKTPDFFDQVSARGTTNYAAIRPSHVLEYQIPLPPMEEQRRIVAKIDELAAKIEKAHFLRQKATEEAETVLSSEISYLFSKGKENGWNAGFLRDYVIDDCYGTSEKASDDNSGTPIFRMGNIQSGRLDLRNLKYLHLNDRDRTKLLLEKGDILVNRTNSAELVGKCAVFDLEGEYGFASYLIRLRLDKNRAEPRLVASYINSPIGRAYMFSERKQMTGQANVNATKLKAFPIVLPSLTEQCRIVAYLDGLQAKVEMLKQVGAQTSTELAALLPSILDKAFKGEL